MYVDRRDRLSDVARLGTVLGYRVDGGWQWDRVTEGRRRRINGNWEPGDGSCAPSGRVGGEVVRKCVGIVSGSFRGQCGPNGRELEAGRAGLMPSRRAGHSGCMGLGGRANEVGQTEWTEGEGRAGGRIEPLDDTLCVRVSWPGERAGCLECMGEDR